MSRNETAQYELDVFKLCCRMLELHRRTFLAAEWKRHADIMPRGQFFNLMQIRFILPCNLSKIMELTGLTSAGASLFVDKLVQQGYLTRTDDPSDRRNVLIDVSVKGRELLSGVEDRLNVSLIPRRDIKLWSTSWRKSRLPIFLLSRCATLLPKRSW